MIERRGPPVSPGESRDLNVNRIGKMTLFGVVVDPQWFHNAPILRTGVGQAGRRCRVNFGSRSTAYRHLLRGMDRLIAVKDKAEPAIAKIFHAKDKAEGDLVFYDITSTWFK